MRVLWERLGLCTRSSGRGTDGRPTSEEVVAQNVPDLQTMHLDETESKSPCPRLLTSLFLLLCLFPLRQRMTFVLLSVNKSSRHGLATVQT